MTMEITKFTPDLTPAEEKSSLVGCLGKQTCIQIKLFYRTKQKTTTVKLCVVCLC